MIRLSSSLRFRVNGYSRSAQYVHLLGDSRVPRACVAVRRFRVGRARVASRYRSVVMRLMRVESVVPATLRMLPY